MYLVALLDDEEAVSPVIGVVLMVAITVILAAVVGTFVLGVGAQMQHTAPNVQMSFSYSDATLTVTHTGGDGVPHEQVTIFGDGFHPNEVDNVTWDDFSTHDYAAGQRISAGHSATVQFDSGADRLSAHVVWTSADGSRSSTLGRWSR